jgi:lipoprotein-anchoring transpeptidase ErfK/SrfK
MIRRYGLFLLTLPAAAVFSAAPAIAQYYSAPPPGYYRSGPPPGAYYDDQLPPPAFWNDDDDDDQPVRRPYRSPQMGQVPPGQAGPPSRILPYPDEAEDTPPPSPGFAPPGGRPPYGHQLDQQMPATAALPPEDQPEQGQPKELAPNLKKQLVTLSTKEPAGTIIIDTPNTYLYLVLGGGNALRYGIGVGREGFTWSGTERISKMKDSPDWFPPSEMIERQPYLPRMMAGGPGNPLGARALYLGHTLYRIHGTNQPSTIGTFVSSGCIRLLNEDIEDLYSRVQVGTRVVVMPGKAPETAGQHRQSAER